MLLTRAKILFTWLDSTMTISVRAALLATIIQTASRKQTAVTRLSSHMKISTIMIFQTKDLSTTR
ncbi:hypothetical protein [uncultured Ruminococcus sp.]|uniref:hypothetical protein n=1 Tax=uncultured Ruminococcus sp. TaxID=165186 RepID=UPI00345BCDF4